MSTELKHLWNEGPPSSSQELHCGSPKASASRRETQRPTSVRKALKKSSLTAVCNVCLFSHGPAFSTSKPPVCPSLACSFCRTDKRWAGWQFFSFLTGRLMDCCLLWIYTQKKKVQEAKNRWLWVSFAETFMQLKLVAWKTTGREGVAVNLSTSCWTTERDWELMN